MVDVGLTLEPGELTLISVQPHSVDKVTKSRIVADGIEVGMDLQKLHDVGVLFVGQLQRGECRICFAESEIRIHKGACWNVA